MLIRKLCIGRLFKHAQRKPKSATLVRRMGCMGFCDAQDIFSQNILISAPERLKVNQWLYHAAMYMFLVLQKFIPGFITALLFNGACHLGHFSTILAGALSLSQVNSFEDRILMDLIYEGSARPNLQMSQTFSRWKINQDGGMCEIFVKFVHDNDCQANQVLPLHQGNPFVVQWTSQPVDCSASGISLWLGAGSVSSRLDGCAVSKPTGHCGVCRYRQDATVVATDWNWRFSILIITAIKTDFSTSFQHNIHIV